FRATGASAEAICGDPVPTIEFSDRSPELLLYWLGIANSFCLDFLARKKGANHMTYTILDSLPLPSQFGGTAIEIAVGQRALRLAATGPEMSAFWASTAPLLSLDPDKDTPTEVIDERRALRAEIDVLVARDF